ncbi:MAG: tetratricopeptide repeat protein, partial [Verrucomicrobiota bacterium]
FAPNDPETNNNLGTALRELGQLDEAVACFRKAAASRPDYSEAYNNLGLARQEQGQLQGNRVNEGDDRGGKF